MGVYETPIEECVGEKKEKTKVTKNWAIVNLEIDKLSKKMTYAEIVRERKILNKTHTHVSNPLSRVGKKL